MHRLTSFSAIGLLLLLFNLFVTTTARADEVSKDTLIEVKCSTSSKLYKTSNLGHVSVHDPSIVVDNSGSKKTYYVFGSHLGVASSTNLKSWTSKYNTGKCSGMFGTMDANGKVTPLSSYTNAYRKSMTTSVRALADGDTVMVAFGPFDNSAWNTSSGVDVGGNQWAPDVIWNPYMKKWCLYMSLNGNDWRSVIVLLTADAITGPYVCQGPVTFSGFQWTSIPEASYKLTDLEMVIGTQKSLPSRYNVGSS